MNRPNRIGKLGREEGSKAFKFKMGEEEEDYNCNFSHGRKRENIQ
jgi:hypothetical protein